MVLMTGHVPDLDFPDATDDHMKKKMRPVSDSTVPDSTTGYWKREGHT